MTTAPFKWTRQTGRETRLARIPFSRVDVPDEYERNELAEDDADGRSIKVHGQKQPGYVLENGDRFTLVDGVRRLRLSEKNGAADFYARIDTVPTGVPEKQYRDRLRFILNAKRQDLIPSQRAAEFRKAMEFTGLSQKEVAAISGWNEGTISNWLVVDTYHPEIRRAIDTREINAHQARCFDGLTPEAQLKVFRQLRKDLPRLSGDDAQRLVASRFHPKKHPALYVDAEKSIAKLVTKKRGRTKKRVPLSRNEKQVLLNSVELVEIEAETLEEENKRMKRECVLAAVPLNAIIRNPRLRDRLSPDMRGEIERFCEIF